MNDIRVTILRKLTSEQIEELKENLMFAFNRQEALAIDEESVNTFYHDVAKKLDNQEGFVIIASRNKRIAGSVIVNQHRLSFLQHTAYVHKLMVSPRNRGLGIGPKLLLAVEEECKKLGIERLELSYREGNPAGKLYEKLGYQSWGIAHKSSKFGFNYFNHVHMEKFL